MTDRGPIVAGRIVQYAIAQEEHNIMPTRVVWRPAIVLGPPEGVPIPHPTLIIPPTEFRLPLRVFLRPTDSRFDSTGVGGATPTRLEDEAGSMFRYASQGNGIGQWRWPE